MISHAKKNSSARGNSISRTDLISISNILKKTAGISLPESAERLVYSRLSKRMSQLGLESISDYVQYLGGSNRDAEMPIFVDLLTTNTTRFFREPAHFVTLEQMIMPQLVKKARAGGRVRIWSAASSSGEEAYSIAAVVLKVFPDVGRHDFRILGTDISIHSLQKASAARYDARSAQDVPADTRQAMFTGDFVHDMVSIRKELCDIVTFRYLNFIEPWPVKGPFDVIFCRNAAIYMDSATQLELWRGFDRVLDKDGFLFIGHSERIGPELSEKFEMFATTSFRRPQNYKH